MCRHANARNENSKINSDYFRCVLKNIYLQLMITGLTLMIGLFLSK